MLAFRSLALALPPQAPEHGTVRMLEEAADGAELLPFFPEDPTPADMDEFGRPMLIGGFATMTTEAVAGQVLPSEDQSWLLMSPFTHTSLEPLEVHLNKSKRQSSKKKPRKRANDDDDDMDGATLLRRRMRFLELMVRVSMTRNCDWQNHMDHRTAVPRFMREHDDSPKPKPFRWYSLLKTLLGDTWDTTNTVRCLAALRYAHPRFLMDWNADPIPRNFAELLEVFLMGAIDDDDWLQRAMDDDPVLAELLGEQVNPRPDAPPGKHRIVELGLAFAGGRVSTSLLFNVIEVLERFGEAQATQIEKQRAKNMTTVEFRVTALRFEHSGEIAGSAVEQLGGLLRSKHMYVDTLQLGLLNVVEDRCLQRCLSALVTPLYSKGRGRLRRLACENDSKSFAAFASAMRYDSAIEHLDVGYAVADVEKLAAWLAFGIFHPDSMSRVNTVRIMMQGHPNNEEALPPYAICTPQFVEIFKRVLGSIVSPEDLASLDTKTLRNRKRKRNAGASEEEEEVALSSDKMLLVEVQSGTNAYQQPSTRSAIIATVGVEDDEDEEMEEGEETKVSPVTQYQVIRKRGDWTAVAVPGAGAGWIESAKIIAEKSVDSAVGAPSGDSARLLTNRRVKSLTWMGRSLPTDNALKKQHADSVMELLKIIGEPLEVLQLPNMALENEHLAQILAFCPNLKELNVSKNRITDISPLVQAYEADECKIRVLSIAQRGEYHERVLQQATAILAMSERQGQKSVIHQLAVRVTPFHYDRLIHYIDTVIPALQKAIFESTKLEYVRLECADQDHGHLANELARLAFQTRIEIATVNADAPEINDGAGNGERASGGAATTNRGEDAMTESAIRMTQRAISAAQDEDNLRRWRSRPLSARTKAACLSVLHHPCTQQSALSQLDTGVMGHIFGFARTIQPRQLDLAPDQPI